MPAHSFAAPTGKRRRMLANIYLHYVLVSRVAEFSPSVVVQISPPG